MSKKEYKPYIFPEELPAREQKIDNGCIVDVVVNEIQPPKPEQTTREQYMSEQNKNRF